MICCLEDLNISQIISPFVPQAAQMEEPFSILPMEKMTGGIRLSADEHVEWKEFTDETLGMGAEYWQQAQEQEMTTRSQ